MNMQEVVERDVRMALGDMTLQLIMARARIAELEAKYEPEEAEVRRSNGKMPHQEVHDG